jgi:carboxymethylenebutenolidase
MCDDLTEAENAAFLKQNQLNRREWGLGAGATVASLIVGCGPSSGSGTSAPEASPADPDSAAADDPAALPTASEAPATKRRQVTIATSDGEAEALFVVPSEGRHPAVIIWPDIAGLREAFEAMATRLAGSGYAVLAVNHYYRSSKLPILETFADWRTEAGRAKIAPMREALTADAITRDASAFVTWIDEQPEVDTQRKIGTTGYCMGGPFTFRTAAAAPTRIGAIASFHGGGLVGEAEDSPHRLFPQMKAAALVCIAQNDDERQPDAKSALRDAAQSAGLPAEVEVYSAQHGWTVVDSPVYDEPEAERAWARLLATFEAHL